MVIVVIWLSWSCFNHPNHHSSSSNSLWSIFVTHHNSDHNSCYFPSNNLRIHHHPSWSIIIHLILRYHVCVLYIYTYSKYMGFLTIYIDPAEEGVGMSLVTKFVLFVKVYRNFLEGEKKYIYIQLHIDFIEPSYVKSHFLLGKSSCLASISMGLWFHS